jgi:hypothetical protein
VLDDALAIDDEVGRMPLDAAVVAERLGEEAGAHRARIVASDLAVEHSAERLLDTVGAEDLLLRVGDHAEREVEALLALHARQRRVEEDHRGQAGRRDLVVAAHECPHMQVADGALGEPEELQEDRPAAEVGE